VRQLAPAFSAGWWFGFGFFLAGLWWIGAAFLVEADEFAWLMPLAIIGLPAGLALFFGLGAALAQLLWSEDWRRIFALAAGLGASEWLRAHILSGFPWNALGYALTAGEILMQSAALFGVYALTVVAVALFAAPAVLAPAMGRRSFVLPALSMTGLALLGLYGALRLAQAEAAFVPDMSVRIVQPALSQLQKWDQRNKDEVLSTYFRLSAPEESPLTPGTLLVWPESAFPYPLTREPGTLAAIAELLPPETALVTGAYRTESAAAEAARYFNTIYVIGDEGTILDAYDKVHLVPFGEYLPAAATTLDRIGIRQLTGEGFSPGPPRQPLALPFGPLPIPLICYEAIFSGELIGEGDVPGFLLNVTNDGWFGRTIGPYQHFHQARVRSVEEGLPLVRAANTGISATVDAYGRIVAEAELGDETMIEGRLPAAILPPPYAEWRWPIFLGIWAACLSLAATRFIYRVSEA
jgi:apolipoprotein N-acyltransferase